MTEQVCGNGLGWLKHNVDLNRENGKNLKGVEALACDWTHYLKLAGQSKGDCVEDNDEGVNSFAHSRLVLRNSNRYLTLA